MLLFGLWVSMYQYIKASHNKRKTKGEIILSRRFLFEKQMIYKIPAASEWQLDFPEL